MKKVVFSVMAAAVLSACGGGGGDSVSAPVTPTPSTPVTPTPSTPGTDAVATASAAVVAQIGATAVPGNTDSTQAFDVTAAIGDTWRLLLNQDGSYQIRVLATEYGLSDSSGTYSQSGSGNIVVLTEANGKFVLTLDKRTRTIAGKVTLGTKTSTVAGSGYAVPADTSKLAGDYVYFGSIRNAVGGGNQEGMGGSFRIAADGSSITLCDKGLINASGNCDSVSTDFSAERVALTLAKDAVSGLTMVKKDGNDFGILSLQAGDRGPVLAIDRFGTSDSGVRRAGALYAVKQQALAGNEANGSWTCFDRGANIGTVVANGNAVEVTEADGSRHAETFHYNTIQTFTANGFITLVANGDPVTEGLQFVPLSSSLAVVELDDSVGVCHISN